MVAAYNKNNRTVRSGSFVFIFVLLAAGVFVSCSRPLTMRPQNVPEGAVLVPGGKIAVWWQTCAMSTVDKAVHCRIWNGNGLVLYDEVFDPYDQRSIAVSELNIDGNARLSGPDRIFLANGRLLIPHSRFRNLKEFFDHVYAVASEANAKTDKR